MISDRTRVKICGLTRTQDLDAAVAAGADAIGLVFYPPSRRCLTLDQAAALRARVPAFVGVTALFVNPDAQAVRQVIEVVRPDLLQFHGEESPDFCAAFGARHMKAFRVGAPGLDTAAALARACSAHGQAAGWLFDSYSAGYGGSGSGFDTALLAEVPRGAGAPALILSGGMKAETVGGQIAALAPFAVDVSSGVESAPGIKDPARIQAFMRAVRAADAARTAA
ncbi:phosphoribosylanthranilate isomerase [uncultured Castellaniella sp.]|uniref:phosphoribosylanthranilate isomerase n=1 Tax=uncultured Castellaniella sp. TaxID=647907 RepID=UPI00262DE269|nr:phosphoribosylanthranilate isomerase [uncultured Castellaniella sp.]